MADWKEDTQTKSLSTRSEIRELVETIKQKANTLHQSGWSDEATYLYNWANELQQKSSKSGY